MPYTILKGKSEHTILKGKNELLKVRACRVGLVKEADLEAAVSDIIAIFTFTFEIYVQLSQHFAKMAMLKEYILILVDLLF